MSSIDRDARITVQLTWDEAGFLWEAGAAVHAVTTPGRFVFTDERGRQRGAADAAVRHSAVGAGSVLWCGTHVQARMLARVLTASGHLAHILGDTELAHGCAWVVLTSCALTDAPGSGQETGPARALRAVG